MGKLRGFIEFDRTDPGYRPADERIRDFHPVEQVFSTQELNNQAARCMNCGIPFCMGAGCPLGNIIPEFNDAAYRENWPLALDLLLSTSSFPEFTARICPAPCEASCVCEYGDGQPVAIRQIEYAVIEKGFELGLIGPHPPAHRNGKKVAVIGSGPAGLSVAQGLNQRGFTVTVYDEGQYAGGLLRYGIPDFKLDKAIVQRRIDLMEAEGVRFELAVRAGMDVSARYLLSRYDAVCIAAGSREPRDLPIPGRDLDGVFFAMDFLARQNQLIGGEINAESVISAKDKDVIVIGGGDTGSDCVGTSNRHGARSVTQLEIMPKPPDERALETPWPLWPAKIRTSSSHKEGCERLWQVSATAFKGKAGKLSAVQCIGMEVSFDGGRPVFTPQKGTEFLLDAGLVLLAMGFVGPVKNPLHEDMGLALDGRGNLAVDARHMTSRPGVFAAGDAARGQSLVVRAMADGRDAAADIAAYVLNNSTP